MGHRTNSLGVGYWAGMTSGCWCIGEGECPPLTDCDAIAAEWKMGGSAAFGCVWALVGIMYGARVFLPSMCKVGRRYHVTRMNELCELLLYVDDPFLTRPDVWGPLSKNHHLDLDYVASSMVQPDVQRRRRLVGHRLHRCMQ